MTQEQIGKGLMIVSAVILALAIILSALWSYSDLLSLLAERQHSQWNFK